MNFNGKAFILILSAVVLLSGCKSGGESPGRIWFPDMTYSQAYEAYAESPIPNSDGDSISARKPVKD
jgi:hypothetical protein